jgi:pimeloyl-ACP methyl ester carboxylesterase
MTVLLGWAFMIGIAVSAASASALLIAFAIEVRTQKRDRTRFSAPGRLIDIGGRRLHIVCKGTAGPTVVLEAGGGQPSVLLMPLLNRVALTSRVCAYDRAGFGWSDPAPGGRSFEDRAHDLHRLLEAAELPPPYVLVGYSFGGLLVRTLARLYPADVGGVVLVDAAEEAQAFAAYQALRHSAEQQGWMATFLTGSGLLRWAIVHRPRAVGVPAASLSFDDREAVARQLSRPEQWRAAKDELSAYERTPADQRAAGGFGRLGALPLIVIAHGKPMRGPMAPLEVGWRSGQERLATLSTHGKLVISERSGHAILHQDPDLVAASIEEVVQAVRRQNGVSDERRAPPPSSTTEPERNNAPAFGAGARVSVADGQPSPGQACGR